MKAIVYFCKLGHSLTELKDKPGIFICGICEQNKLGKYQKPEYKKEVNLYPASVCECGWQGISISENKCPVCKNELL